MNIEWRDVNGNVIEWLEIPAGTRLDLYELLEVSPRASAEVIKKAYRVLVERYHPDKHDAAHNAWADEMTKLINLAYSTLRDESKRRTYDYERVRQQRER